MANNPKNKENLKPFPKGKTGNPKGRPKVLIEINEALLDEIGDTGMREIIKALYKKAKAGDVRAIQEVLDRAYGKAQQSIDHTTKGNEITPARQVYKLPDGTEITFD